MSLVNCEYTLTQTRPYSCRVHIVNNPSRPFQQSDKTAEALATIRQGLGDPCLKTLRVFPPKYHKPDSNGKSRGEGSADLELRCLNTENGIDYSSVYNSEWLRAVASMLSAIADQMDLLPTTDQVQATMIQNKLDN